ncbi:MAG: DUF6894 family protein [Bacillota bacterium]
MPLPPVGKLTMPRYYFHLCDGTDRLLDDEGRELQAADLHAAALAEARGMIAADALEGHIWLGQQIEIRDQGGKVVHVLHFEDAVEVTHGPAGTPAGPSC